MINKSVLAHCIPTTENNCGTFQQQLCCLYFSLSRHKIFVFRRTRYLAWKIYFFLLKDNRQSIISMTLKNRFSVSPRHQWYVETCDPVVASRHVGVVVCANKNIRRYFLLTSREDREGFSLLLRIDVRENVIAFSRLESFRP